MKCAICSANFIGVKLTKAFPELDDKGYLYDDGFRTVLDMIKVKDSFTFRNIAGLNDCEMTRVILFMRKHNLCFGTLIRMSDYDKYFMNNRTMDLDLDNND